MAIIYLINLQCEEMIYDYNIDIEDSRLFKADNLKKFIELWTNLFEELKRDQELKIKTGASFVFSRINQVKARSADLLDIKEGDSDPESEWFVAVIEEILIPMAMSWASLLPIVKGRVIPFDNKAKIIPLRTS